MRLFIGLPLARALVEQLAAFRSSLERPADNLRWSAPESWHITLQFLGTTSAPQYDCLLAHLDKIQHPYIPIRLQAPAFFHRAGIFHVAVETAPELLSLHRAIHDATTPCGFTPEDRPYSPHITLARSRARDNSLRALQSRLGPAPALPGFTAHEFLLYESHLHSSGSRYEVRARFPLHA